MAGKRPGRRLPSALAVALALAVGLVPGAGPGRAQEAGEAYPARIHAGTCDDLGEVVHPLNDVVLLDPGGVSLDEVGTPAGGTSTLAIQQRALSTSLRKSSWA